MDERRFWRDSLAVPPEGENAGPAEPIEVVVTEVKAAGTKPSLPWWEPQRARAIAAVALLMLEVAVLVSIGAWTLVGLVRHAAVTGWSLGGLLTMLHDQWRGAIILGALLFYRTLRDALDRVKLKSLKTVVGDFDLLPADTMKPGTETQK